MRNLRGWQSKIAVFLATVLATVGLASIPPAISAQPPTHELRGVWLTNIDSDILFSRENLNKGINRLANLNFNTVYPTVWNWGSTLYPSQVAAQATGKSHRLYPDLLEIHGNDPRESAQKDRDMLKELVDIAHARNMHVIPWFEFGFMAPADSPLVKRHPEWVTQKWNGTKISMEGVHPRVWLNPFHPEVQQLMVGLVSEVVSRYDVEGIQLDDHFGLPVTYGYDPYTVKLYRQEHKGKRPPKNARDPQWVRWRTNKMTLLMGQVFRSVKANKPQATVSLSPNPSNFAYHNFLQDWVRWVKQGYVEELVIQLYRSDRRRFLTELQHPEVQRARKHIPVSIGILSGLKNRDVSMGWIKQQVKYVRDRKFAGVSFFFYETLWTSQTESEVQRSAGFKTLFKNSLPRSILVTKGTASP
jgi:uncharacterized lipoprotein YddW (UPF0748 family)